MQDEQNLEELLKLAYKKNDEESTLRTNVRTKASFILAGILTIFGAFSKTFYDLKIQQLPTSFIVLLGISFFFFLVSFIFAIIVYIPSSYGGTIMDRIGDTNADEIIQRWKKLPLAALRDNIFTEISFATAKNRKVNARKEKQFLISACCFCFSSILTFFLIFWAGTINIQIKDIKKEQTPQKTSYQLNVKPK